MREMKIEVRGGSRSDHPTSGTHSKSRGEAVAMNKIINCICLVCVF